MPKMTLSHQEDISNVLRSGRKHSHQNILFCWKKSQIGRLGVSCSKKVFKNAVDRNVFKRKNRALAQASKLATTQLDLFIIAQPGLSSVTRENRKKVIKNAWTSFLKQLPSS